MSLIREAPVTPLFRPALTAALVAGAIVSSSVAVSHLWETAQRGPICSAAGHSDHCWACYVAPMLIAAAAASTLRRYPMFAKVG